MIFSNDWARYSQPILTADLLKQAIAYLIAEADLPYALVERKSFKYLLQILNPATINMEFGRKTIANEVDLLFFAHQQNLKDMLQGMKYLSYTVDAWTSPNAKAFMAITVHGITPQWKILDCLVGMPAVNGKLFDFPIILVLINVKVDLIIFRSSHW